ncbi:MAG: 3-deoxy-D-manno-octulosonate 8-phosphate phosphatase KdsC, partial [Verrucomicrobiota bacterium]
RTDHRVDGRKRLMTPRPQTRSGPTPARKPAARGRIARISKSRWAAIRLFAMDVDGVLTNGTVSISSDGSEAKVFSILDGLGLRRLDQAGVQVAWISGRPSDATTRRAQELKIPHLIQGRIDKKTVLQELAQRLGLEASHCVYMGDDDIDAPALAWAGIGIAPTGAIAAALAAADYIPTRPAGLGAVREVCEHILAARVVSSSA